MKVDFSELGYSGLNRWGGYVFEEFLPALKGIKGIRVYKEMSENDPVIGAILFVIKQLIRRTSWRVDAAGSSREDEAAKDFLESCMHDMSQTWADTISEMLSMLVYGWSFHEEVYKVRLGDNRDPRRKSKYNDGRIGWRKLPGRAQETLHSWVFDEDGGIKAMRQLSPPDYIIVEIPIEKALLFRTEVLKNSPEGRSVLRNAYRPWYFKKRIEEIEGIGIERDLAGLPVLMPPEGLDIWNDQDPEMSSLRMKAEKLVRSIRRDQNEGVVLPSGWSLTLLSTGSRRNFDTNAVIQRYDQRIAMTVLADILLLGAQKVGSYALAEVKKTLLSAAIEAWLDSVTEILNRHGVARLFALNNFKIKDHPKIVHGEVETPDLKEIGDYVSKLAGAGATLFPDDELENYLRSLASMPLKVDEKL